MNFKLEIQEGVYYIDVSSTNKADSNKCYELGTMILDIKRNQYYLVPNESRDQTLSKDFISIMEKLFLADLVPIKEDHPYGFNQSRTGVLAPYAEEKFLKSIEDYGIEFTSVVLDERTEKVLEEEDFNQLLTQYNKGHYPETRMYGIR